MAAAGATAETSAIVGLAVARVGFLNLEVLQVLDLESEMFVNHASARFLGDAAVFLTSRIRFMLYRLEDLLFHGLLKPDA